MKKIIKFILAVLILLAVLMGIIKQYSELTLELFSPYGEASEYISIHKEDTIQATLVMVKLYFALESAKYEYGKQFESDYHNQYGYVISPREMIRLESIFSKNERKFRSFFGEEWFELAKRNKKIKKEFFQLFDEKPYLLYQ